MPIAEHVVDLSRIQFALTALYHFLFVPLTLGLSVLLAIMETIYVMTDKPIWREMVKYWGILFGINFAMGVATGITMEFQFGTNWAYYAHYVGDIFGAPLAIEGMMAFFLEATFVGMFFFGWERLSKYAHCIVTWLLALGTNLSAMWILIANGWMVHPVGAKFDINTMRMEVTHFYDVIFNEVAQTKFVHTISAGYVTGAMFVLSISAYFMLRGRNIEFARRSMTIAASFGLASALSVVVLGDESGFLANEHQHMKLAVMEGIWNTEAPPAGLALFGIPDQANKVTRYKVEIPYGLGIIATHSFNTPLPGINQLVDENKVRIERGMKAYAALKALQKDKTDTTALAQMDEYENDLGYGLLLKRYTDKVVDATPAQISQAADDTVPRVAPMFWSFRFMVASGFYLIFLFAMAFYFSAAKRLNTRWFLKMAMFSLPIPWVAIELGWFVAEYGRQPWSIQGVLPTFLGVSSVSSANVLFSLIAFIVFYTSLAIIELILMQKYIRLGPDGLAKQIQ